MIKIYHNPRCSKSRQGLQIVEESGKPFEVILYLKEPLTFEDVKDIINILEIKPIEIIRKNENDWKLNFKGKELSDNEIIQAIVDFPKLLERPIVTNLDKAVIGRPPENISNIL